MSRTPLRPFGRNISVSIAISPDEFLTFPFPFPGKIVRKRQHAGRIRWRPSIFLEDVHDLLPGIPPLREGSAIGLTIRALKLRTRTRAKKMTQRGRKDENKRKKGKRDDKNESKSKGQEQKPVQKLNFE
ncbi:unnamed protein product, partial [Nesidiocoris tenuis]